MNPTDAELVAQVLAGQQNQYQFLVAQYSDAVFNTAYRLLGNYADAADVTQDTFIRAYNALHTFRTDEPMRPWLCRIATNQSLNRLRQRKPVFSLDNHPAGTDSIPVPDYSMEPQRTVLKSERDQQLRLAILSLPPPQRAIIELRHFQDQSYAEQSAIGCHLPRLHAKLYRIGGLIQH